MKKFAFVLMVMAAALAMTPVALAGTTLCPSNADAWSWDGAGSSGNVVPGPLDATCGANSAVQFYLPNVQNDDAALWWANSTTGLTVGNIASFSASVVNVGVGQPYYSLYFTSPGGLSGGSVGDTVEMLEFQSNALSGPGGGTLALNPATTLFDIYDFNTGGYIAGGQAGAMTLDQWALLDPDLAGDPTWVGIQMGVAGGCPVSGSCSETLTINSADYSVTPEPSSLLLLGTGLLGAAGALFRRSRLAGRFQKL